MIRRNSTPLGVNWSHPLNRGLVAWWPFSHFGGSVLRDVAKGNNGSLTAMESSDWVAASYGGGRLALEYGGTDEHVVVASPANLDFTNKVFCWSMWFRVVSTATQYLMAKDVQTSGYGCYLSPSNALNVVFSGNVEYSSGIGITTGAWHHLVLTADGTTMDVYLDGTVKANDTMTQSITDVGSNLFFAQDENGNFNATVRQSDVRMSSRYFHPYEVQQLYEESRQGYPNLFRRQSFVGVSPQHHARRSVAIRRKTKTTVPQANWSHPLNKNLKAWWTFKQQGGVILEDAVRQRHATLTNMDPGTDWVPSNTGDRKALEFDGSNDYATCGDLDIVGNKITIAAWVKVVSSPSTFGMILAKDNSYELGINSSNQVYWRVSNGNYLNTLNTALTTGQWYHLIGVYDGVNRYVYINGKLDATHAQTGNLTQNAETTNVGARKATQYWINAQISDVRLYCGALPGPAAKQLYDESIQDNPNLLNRSRIIPARTQTYESSKGVIRKVTPGVNWSHPLNDGLVAWMPMLRPDYRILGKKAGVGGGYNVDTDDWVGTEHGRLAIHNDSGEGVLVGEVDDADFEFANNFTVSIWCSYYSIARYDIVVANCQYQGKGWRIWTRDLSSHKIYWECYDGQVENVVSTTAITTDSEWFHIVGTHDGTSLHLYINGQEEGTPEAVTDLDYGTGSTRCVLGMMTDHVSAATFYRHHDGRLTDFRCYDRALNAAAVNALYQESRQGYPNLLNPERILPANKRLTDPVLSNPTESSITDTTATISITTDTTE